MAPKLDAGQKKRVSKALNDSAELAKLESAAELHGFADEWNYDDGVDELLGFLHERRLMAKLAGLTKFVYALGVAPG